MDLTITVSYLVCCMFSTRYKMNVFRVGKTVQFQCCCKVCILEKALLKVMSKYTTSNEVQ